MTARGVDTDGAYGYFVTRTQAIAHALGKQVRHQNNLSFSLLSTFVF